MVNSPDKAPGPSSSEQPSSSAKASPEETIAQDPISQDQANAILAELNVVKQRLLWILVIMGFFAARALFFHY